MKIFGYELTRTAAPPKAKGGVLKTSADLAEFMLDGDTASGVTVNSATAMRHAAVYSCIKVLSESVGQLPLQVIESKAGIKTLLPDSNAQKVLNMPNDAQTGQEFWETVVIHLKLRGNFYALIDRFNGRLTGLLPFHAGQVTPKRRPDGSVVYHVVHNDGRSDVLESSEVLHLKNISADGLVGLSDIGQARESIGLSMATEKHGNKLFKNGAKPQGILTTDEVLSDETYERIKKSWQESHEGVENAHKTAILESGLNYKSLIMTQEDAQFLDTRKYQRSEICGLFRVPPHMIGDLERATFSNIEWQGQDFVTYSLMPILMRIENRLNLTVLTSVTDANRQARFEVQSLLRGDMKARAAYYTQMEQAGALSPNEIRGLEYMNPRDGGDIYLTPMNMNINGKKPDEPEDTSKTV